MTCKGICIRYKNRIMIYDAHDAYDTLLSNLVNVGIAFAMYIFVIDYQFGHHMYHMHKIA
jgi:hypothetical protein